MKKFLLILLTLITHNILLSCAATVKFQVEHPPLVDLRAVDTITVIPFEWNENGRYRYLANDVTQALTAGIKRGKTYTFVDPSVLRDIDTTDYWEYVDVYIIGEIISVDSRDESEEKEEKSDEKTTTKIYITRTVWVDIEYKYIRAINNEVLGVFKKTEKHSATFDNSKRSEKFWANLLLDIFIPKGPSAEKLAKSAAANFSRDIWYEIASWTAMEKRYMEKSTKKDKRFNEAQKLVRQKRYFFALVLYKEIYEETGSVVAGYNTAVLLEVNGQFKDALELLEELDEKISQTGIDSPPFIKKEIEKVKELIGGFEVLEDYQDK